MSRSALKAAFEDLGVEAGVEPTIAPGREGRMCGDALLHDRRMGPAVVLENGITVYEFSELAVHALLSLRLVQRAPPELLHQPEFLVELLKGLDPGVVKDARGPAALGMACPADVSAEVMLVHVAVVDGTGVVVQTRAAPVTEDPA